MEATLHSGLQIIGGASDKTRKIIFSTPPSSNYSRLSERLRKNVPTEIQCALFCGGRRCKYELYDCWQKEDMAIEGVFSHWVTDEILAMARPNSEVINSKKIVEQFKRLGIQSLINLQQPGEHSKCGPLLENCGFSYDPEIFMKESIYFYNFSMRDYGEAGENRILDMVKVMSFALSEGKVAIHCHAGLGRTGVLIACYLIFHLKVSANQAMQFVRSKRPNSIQTRSQIQCCQLFERYILSLCDVFSNKDGTQEKKSQELTLTNYIKKQQQILHGYETKHFKYIPKIIFILGECLLGLINENTIQLKYHWPPFTKNYLVAEPLQFNMEIIARISESDLIDMKNTTKGTAKETVEKTGNKHHSKKNKEENPARNKKHESINEPQPPALKCNPTEVKKDGCTTKEVNVKVMKSEEKAMENCLPAWKSLPVLFSISESSIEPRSSAVDNRTTPLRKYNSNPEISASLKGHMQSPQGMELKPSTGERKESQKIVPPAQESSLSVKGNKTVRRKGNGKIDRKSKTKVSQQAINAKHEEKISANKNSESNGGTVVEAGNSVNPGNVESVGTNCSDTKSLMEPAPTKLTQIQELMLEAIIRDHSQLTEKDCELLNKLKTRLTHQALSWNMLVKEKNKAVLTGLLFEWLEHLHKPLLGKDELSYVVILGHKPVSCLKKFPFELQYTLEYLLRLVHRMFPANEEFRTKFLKRLMASLTHQTILIDGYLAPAGKSFPKLREGTLRKVLEFGITFIELLTKNNGQEKPHK